MSLNPGKDKNTTSYGYHFLTLVQQLVLYIIKDLKRQWFPSFMVPKIASIYSIAFVYVPLHHPVIRVIIMVPHKDVQYSRVVVHHSLAVVH